jgi:ankyrin repeat protein
MDHKTIELLIKYGADATFVKRGNVTALQIACRSAVYGVDTIRLLVEHGCPINLQKDDCGNSPLGNATMFDVGLGVIKYLVSVGADIHAEDCDGNTPLMRLCSNTRMCTLEAEFLIQSGADLNHRNHEGYSTLGVLCQGDGDPDMLQILIDHGMDVNAVENGFTYPMIATLNDNWEAVLKLLESGFSNTQILHPETAESLAEIVQERSIEYWDEDTIRKINSLFPKEASGVQ